MSDFREKVDFVKNELTALVVKVAPNIESLEYAVYANVNHEDWTTEILLVHYVGGAVQARNCSADSLRAIADEALGMIHSSQSNRLGGCDTSWWKEIDAKTSADADPRYRQKRLY